MPFVVGNQLDISKSGMYLRTGALDRTVYVTCESLQAEPLLGDGWEDVTEVSVRRLEYPVEMPESMRGKVFSPSGALTADEAQIVMLYVVAGFKHREIAEIVKKPVGTVLWTYNNSRKRLKKYLKEEQA